MKYIMLSMILISAGMNGDAQIKRGHPAPELSLPDMTGKIVHLSDLKGKVVLVDFWASWCPPCRKNNPHLVEIYHKYHDKGLEIYSVSIDEKDSAWKEAVQLDQLEWPQMIDNKGWYAPSVFAYDLQAIPASFLLDRNGVIQKVDLVGIKLESAIEALLKN
jgi:peroxiredoxin